MREQRLVFGEVAELYDGARAGYSEAVVDDVLHYLGGDSRARRALEVGAGTGKATVAFAARGLAIVALEPSAGSTSSRSVLWSTEARCSRAWPTVGAGSERISRPPI